MKKLHVGCNQLYASSDCILEPIASIGAATFVEYKRMRAKGLFPQLPKVLVTLLQVCSRLVHLAWNTLNLKDFVSVHLPDVEELLN